MVELFAAAALAPWAQPLRFRPLPGWRAGASGTVHSVYRPDRQVPAPKQSTAWIARNVRYGDRASADPPNATLAHLPPDGIVVWAVIYETARRGRRAIELQLGRARRYDCCEGAYVAGGEYELTGTGPRRAYTVIVRIYFGSPPTRALRAEAQHALDHLKLPSPRSRRPGRTTLGWASVRE